MSVIAALELPPIGHPVFLAALAGAWVVGLVALRPALPIGQGPSAAWTDAPTPRWRTLAVTLALGGLATLCYAVILRPSAFPPVSSEHRAGAGIGGLTVLACLWAMAGVGRLVEPSDTRPRSRLPAGLWVGIAAGVLGLLMGAAMFLPRIMGTAPGAGLLAALATAGGTMLITCPIAALEHRGRSVAASVILAGVLLAGSAALLGSGSISYGQIGLGLAVGAVGLSIAGAMKRGGNIGALPIALSSACLAGLLAGGREFSFLPWYSGVILACAPLCGLLAARLAGGRVSAKGAGVIAVLAAALVAGAGAGSAISIEGRSGEYDLYEP